VKNFNYRGARFGLTLNGKLARIAAQEALLLQKLNSPKVVSELKQGMWVWFNPHIFFVREYGH